MLFFYINSIIIIVNLIHSSSILKSNTFHSRILRIIFSGSIYICITLKYDMPRCPSKLQRIYIAATFEIISCQGIHLLWFTVQYSILWCWRECVSQILYWHKCIQMQWKFFHCKSCHGLCQRGGFNISQILIKILWYSYVSRTSWIDVRSLRWIAKTLSTLLVIRLPAWVIVALIWRIMRGIRNSTMIASRTPKQVINFVKRTRLFQVLINLSLSSFLYKNPIRLVSRTVLSYWFYIFFLQK